MEALVPISASFEKLRHLLWKPVNKDCRWCQELYETGVRIPAKELIQGTLAGCPACQLLYQTVDPANTIDPRIELVSVWYFGDYVKTFGDSFVSHIFDPKSEETSRRLCREEGFNKGRWHVGDLIATTATYPPVERCVELFSEQGSTSHWPLIATATHVAPTADTPESVELIKAWLSECEKKHHGCKKTHSILPDRVVFVGSGGDPRLVETQGTQGKYIALSHRWGGHVSLQLKKDSLDDFKRGIPFSRFPRTFQDAITICRALEVENIWIDSICIIQDSKEDWDIQGSKMDQVYANCLLTIAADGAENGDSGFIRNPAREVLKNKTRKTVCTGPKGQVGEIFIRPLRQFGSRGGFGRHYDSWERGDLEASQRLTEQGSYLLKRGWVLQETFLPRRILHFLPDEFSWRCASVSRCECKVRPHDKKRVVHEPLDLELPREINTENLKEYWKEVVEQYTRRQLTFPSDRLVALAGLASRAHSINLKVNYYAGLWSDVLPSTLLWIVDRPVEVESSECACKRIEPAIAPTWSWASVTGYARFLFWERNFGRGKWAKSPPDLTIIHIDCISPGPNRYGSVVNAKLQAEGYLCNVHVRLTSGSQWHFPCSLETRILGGTLGKSKGLFYADTDEFLESCKKEVDRISMTVAAVYESRMFLVLRKVGGNEVTFERAGVIYCEEENAIPLPTWGQRKQFTFV